MVKLVFATSNQDKLSESRRIIEWLASDQIQILDQNQARIKIEHEIDETGYTFAQNSYIKALVWLKQSKLPVLAEDTGLCVEALGGQPGVKSNRWLAGSTQDRNQQILKLLQNQSNRRAYFVSVFCLLYPSRPDSPVYFAGYTPGSITQEQAGIGQHGFGYDPIFIPDGSQKSYAQMTGDQKDKFSHRARAFKQLLAYLGVQSDSTAT